MGRAVWLLFAYGLLVLLGLGLDQLDQLAAADA